MASKSKSGMSPAAARKAKAALQKSRSGMDKNKDKTHNAEDPVTAAATSLGMSNSGYVRMQKKKSTHIYTIIYSSVVVVCVIIFFGVRGCMKLVNGRNSSTPAQTTSQVSPATSTKTSSQQNSGTSSTRPPALVSPSPGSSSPLWGKYSAVASRVKSARVRSKEDIDEIIAMWQKFIDENEDKYPNDKYIKKAKLAIKNQQNLRKYY